MKGVLLDVDGTLVLSNDAHAHSWVEAFDTFGYRITFAEVRALIGMGGDKLIPKLVPSLNHEEGKGKEISQYRTKIFLEKYAPQLQPAPGARELVLRFQEQGIKQLVASSAKSEELQVLLKAARVEDVLTESTTSSDAEKSKPDPDIVHVALEKIALPAQQLLMIGDTPYDVEAATKAGVRIVAVRCGGWNDADLQSALAVFNDPADILAHIDVLP